MNRYELCLAYDVLDEHWKQLALRDQGCPSSVKYILDEYEQGNPKATYELTAAQLDVVLDWDTRIVKSIKADKRVQRQLSCFPKKLSLS